MITVLTADDNRATRDLIRAILSEQADVRIIEAEDGDEALRRIYENLPDIAFIDICMDKVDGMQVIEQIRRNPPARQVRMVALTAQAMAGDEASILAAGFDFYVSKPYRIDVIRRLVTETTEKASAAGNGYE